MSHWNIAAAQYGGQHQSVDDHITHHLRFIAEAARQGCDLLVFLNSLTALGTPTLPPHPMTRSWSRCSTRHIVTGYRYCRAPLERMASARKVALFTPARHRIFAIRKVAEPAWCRERNSQHP
jgi:hypothetical protein